jgi:hypothetical protein
VRVVHGARLYSSPAVDFVKLERRRGTPIGMTARLLLVGAFVTGCWVPFPDVEDDLLPVRRTSRDAGTTPSPDAGRMDAATPDAGGPLPTTATLAPLEGPPPAACGRLRELLAARVAQDAGCGNRCYFTVTEDEGVLAFRSGTGPGAELAWFPVEGGLGPEYLVFTSYRSGGGGRRLVAQSRRSSQLVTLQALGDGNVSVVGQWLGGTFHYVVTEAAPVAGSPARSTLRAWHSASPVEAEVVAELPSPLVAGFGINALTAYAYVLALADGLYEVPLYGVNRRARQVIAAPDLTALVVTDTGPFAYGTRSGQIVFGDWGAPVTSRVVATGLEATSLGVLSYDTLAVFDRRRGVFLVDTRTSSLSLLYAQREFVQGYRYLGAMHVEPFSGQVSVSEICHFDPDSPTWGTVALELPTPPGAVPARPGQARWVTGTADWPWRVPVLDAPAWEPLVHREGSTGAFLVDVVGP